MAPAKDNPPTGLISPVLAGLQAGMLGMFWMLAWFGISAKWQLRSFWTAENLMASIFYGGRSIRSGFSWQTLVGLSVYILIYSLLGAIFALLVALVARRLPHNLRLMLLGVVFASCWYYLSFRLLGRSMMPLVALLHSTRPTALGHVLYGSILGRFPVYVPGAVVREEVREEAREEVREEAREEVREEAPADVVDASPAPAPEPSPDPVSGRQPAE